MDLETLLTRFEREYLDLNSISAKRRREQFSLLRRLADSLDHPLDELTAQEVNGFIGHELADGLHPNTGRFHAGMIRAFVKWGESAGLMPNIQRELISNPRGSSNMSKPKPYKPEEIAALRRALADYYPMAPPRGRGSNELHLFKTRRVPYLRRCVRSQAKRLQLEAQIALALEMGLRSTEILHIPIDAIHPDNVHVVVRNAKQEPGREVNRVVPYTNHARRAVGEWLDFRYLMGADHDFPWFLLPPSSVLSYQTSPLTMRAFRNSLTPLEGHWNWHRLRHTAATEWLRAGMALEKVRVMMGHANIQQTLAYTHISDADMEDAVREAEEQFSRRIGV